MMITITLVIVMMLIICISSTFSLKVHLKSHHNEGKGGKYLEKENVFFAEEKNNGKGGSFARGWSMQIIIFKRSVLLDDYLQ